MNLDNLNKWLTLTANIGVLIGIIVVALELQQTQKSLEGEASTMRAQWAVDIQNYGLETRAFEIRDKVESGEEISPEELARVRMILTSQLRHLENMHYQYQIGILDDEIWEANLRGLGDICNSWSFKLILPNWEENNALRGFRESFADLIAEPCR